MNKSVLSDHQMIGWKSLNNEPATGVYFSSPSHLVLRVCVSPSISRFWAGLNKCLLCGLCCLLYSLSHPLHVKNSIPYFQFLRFRRLCSDDSDFSSNQRRCASSIKNNTILSLWSKQAHHCTSNLIDSLRYKRLKRIRMTEFHHHYFPSS